MTDLRFVSYTISGGFGVIFKERNIGSIDLTRDGDYKVDLFGHYAFVAQSAKEAKAYVQGVIDVIVAVEGK